MADALGVPVAMNPVYPYDESPPLDDIMSYITSSSIRWGSDPRITSAELTKTTYLFFRIACHSFLTYLLSAHHSFGAICIFVCFCYECSY